MACCLPCVGLQKNATGRTSYVMRDCAQGLRPAKCLPESSGGALQCHCQFDFCNDGRAKLTSAASHASAVDVMVITSAVQFTVN